MWNWVRSLLAFIVVSVLALVVILFDLLHSPLHDGSDMPPYALVCTALVLSPGLGLAAAWKLYRSGATRAGDDSESDS